MPDLFINDNKQFTIKNYLTNIGQTKGIFKTMSTGLSWKKLFHDKDTSEYQSIKNGSQILSKMKAPYNFISLPKKIIKFVEAIEQTSQAKDKVVHCTGLVSSGLKIAGNAASAVLFFDQIRSELDKVPLLGQTIALIGFTASAIDLGLGIKKFIDLYGKHPEKRTELIFKLAAQVTSFAISVLALISLFWGVVFSPILLTAVSTTLVVYYCARAFITRAENSKSSPDSQVVSADLQPCDHRNRSQYLAQQRA